mmetsp:Transcript_5438/g.10384  ORF Transcript_5438/g.10384 Transcript_5438/m.10384 type:complete len:99 (-) Transcript_5438:197-493(-)
MHVSPLMSSGRIPIFTLPLVVFESAVALLDEGAAAPDILGTVPVGALALTLETAPAASGAALEERVAELDAPAEPVSVVPWTGMLQAAESIALYCSGV